MGSTDPLTGARYPASQDAPDIATYIQNAVNDLSDVVGGIFTTASARDSAFTAWVSQGNTMKDGLMCRVGGYAQVYRGGSWHSVGSPLFSTTTTDSNVYTSSHTVMTLAIPDPGFPYKVKVGGAVLLSQIGISVYVRLITQVNGTSLAGQGSQFQNNTGSTITAGVVLTTSAAGVSGTLTGASTAALLVSKDAGPAGNGYQAATSDPASIIYAEVWPA